MRTSVRTRVRCNKRKRQRRRRKRRRRKRRKQNWRPPRNGYWKPEGCQHGHHCPKYHPRRQAGRCAICGSTRHYTSQCTRPVKPKAKNAEYDENTWQEDVEWQESTRETEEHEASKGKKGKGKKLKSKGRPKGKSTPRSITPRPSQTQTPRNDRPHPKAEPEARSCVADDFLFAMMSTKSKPTWRHSTCNGADYMICTVVEPQKKLPDKESLFSSLANGRLHLKVELLSMDMMPRA